MKRSPEGQEEAAQTVQIWEREVIRPIGGDSARDRISAARPEDRR